MDITGLPVTPRLAWAGTAGVPISAPEVEVARALLLASLVWLVTHMGAVVGVLESGSTPLELLVGLVALES